LEVALLQIVTDNLPGHPAAMVLLMQVLLAMVVILPVPIMLPNLLRTTVPL
jgi:hypothetical protein